MEVGDTDEEGRGLKQTNNTLRTPGAELLTGARGRGGAFEAPGAGARAPTSVHTRGRWGRLAVCLSKRAHTRGCLSLS